MVHHAITPLRRLLEVRTAPFWITLSLTAVVTTMSADAFALVVCSPVNRATGQAREGAPLRLRTACRTTEVQIDPAAVGLQGPAGAQGPQGESGPQGPAGDPGANGTNGVACWDTDGDHACDSGEDVNGDGGCTAADCVARLSQCTPRDWQFNRTGDDSCADFGEYCIVVSDHRSFNWALTDVTYFQDCSAIPAPNQGFPTAICCK